MSMVTADALALPLADESIDLIITSPPYWGLRDYGFDRQLGMEDSYVDYLHTMGLALRECWRVLTPTGAMWLNVGDTFNTRAIIRPSAHNEGLGHDNESIRSSWSEAAARGQVRYSARQPWLKDKDLMLIPMRVAAIGIDVGFWLRADAIWSKPWSTPENVKDRPRRTHEYVFLFTKSARSAVRRESLPFGSVWEFKPGEPGFSGPAVFPGDLARVLVGASTESGDIVLDPFAGSGVIPYIADSMGRQGVGVDLADRSS
jgi:site-specific DNA-methyltransferase (adenine-specific)